MKKFFLFFLIISFFILSFTANAAEKSKLEKAIGKEAQPKEVLEQFQRDYVLLKQSSFEIENAFSYTYSSAKQIYLESFAILDPVFLTLGRFGIKNTKRHIFTDNVSLRYGLTDNIQFEVAVPLIYRSERYSVISGQGESEEDQTKDKAGIGDVSISLSYQPIRETDTTPAVLLNLGYKFDNGKSPFKIDATENGELKDLPLGTGYKSVKFGINLVKSIDPVVVYGGVSYAYNKKVHVNQTYYIDDDKNASTPPVPYGLVDVDSGDTISLNLGLGYAISYNFSIGFQFIDDYTFATDVTITEAGVEKTKEAPNSTLNSAQFKFTAGWALSERASLNFGLGIGLTSDSPDFVFEVRYPIRF